ncbi:MAG: hypothetical protein ABSC35_02035 [Candidatus Dormibacteria bacterium]
MTITDDRTTPPTPAPTPPSYVRRHPILAGFGVLSGLSLFSALWPVSAIVIAVAIAGHATGLDRAAVLLVERVAARIDASAHHRTHPEPAPVTPAPAAPTPSPEPSAPAPTVPRREVYTPATPAARSRRDPRAPAAHRPVRARRPQTSEHRVGARNEGQGL